jgi:hypothetical protein
VSRRPSRKASTISCPQARGKPIDQVVHSSTRDAVVRVAGRHVQHVARREHRVGAGVKRRRILTGSPGRNAWSSARPVAPAPPAEALQQEHVVRIEVRADAAAGTA